MNVAATNLIRFPDLRPEVGRRTGAPPVAAPSGGEPADVVAFPLAAGASLDDATRTHGLLFSATRLAGRMSDELERTADL